MLQLSFRLSLIIRHIHILPSRFLIRRDNGSELSEEELEMAARLAAVKGKTLPAVGVPLAPVTT
jgi:hypothetical protein